MLDVSADQFFVSGRILTLSLTVDQAVFECNASILRPFLPFTKSQVLLVELQPHISGIPSPIILKVYDPRFINERERRSPTSVFPGQPWSLSLEIAAAQRRKAIALNERHDEEVDYVDSDEPHTSRLQDLQGIGIPRYYASGNLAVDLLRPISPHVLVLEYSEGLSTINLSSVPRSLARSLIKTMHSFASHGIIHCDLRTDNILFSQHPSRVVVIDFGQSILRGDESDSEWEDAVHVEGDENHVKKLLHNVEIRYMGSIFTPDLSQSQRCESLERNGQNASYCKGGRLVDRRRSSKAWLT